MRDDFDRHLAQRLRDYEARLPEANAPDLAATRRGRFAWPLALATGVAAIAAGSVLAVLLSARPTPPIGEASPQPPAASASASAQATASSSASESAPAPTASPTPESGSSVRDTIWRVVVADLVVRTEPGVSDASTILPARLTDDDRVLVVDGPRAADGYGWYQVLPIRPDGLRERPFGWVAAPVPGEDGRVIAVLAIAEPVDAVFASILMAARPGESGETFAFEEDGSMLNAEDFGRVAQLRAQIERLEEGGVILEPFANRHGTPVVGAWRWLPEYGMGVAIQIDVAEAYAPLRYLNIAFSVVFGALVAAVIAALASLFSVMRLRSQLGHRKLGPYELQKQIGEGGVATVYLARHDLLKRPTAVKLLKPARATDEMIARFEREVQLASSFSHPNTVEIFDYGRTRDGLFYYAMEYLDGLTVSQVLERIAFFPVGRSIHVLRQVCAGLSEAHGKGLVHRDIKPENIMVCRYGGEHDFVKILDFGLVKSVSQPHSRDLTRSQRILGTPLYMAPERLRDPTDVDARADIYAVGAVAYLMLTGRRLFDATEDFALTSKILNEEPARLSALAPQAVPRELELLVMACLEKDRANRPQSVAGLVEALDALAAEHRWTQREAQDWWATFSAPPPP